MCISCGNYLAGIAILIKIGELYGIEALKNLRFEDILNVLTKLGTNSCANYLGPENFVPLLELTFRLQNSHCTHHTKADRTCTYCNWDDHGNFENYLRSLLEDVDFSTQLRYERHG